MRTTLSLALLTALLLLHTPGTAQAYIGPGAGLGAFATVFALIGALFLAIVGFLWYPIKRLLRKRPKSSEAVPAPEEADAS